jgi:hypothetical protein
LALVVVLGIVVVFGSILAITFLGRAADDTIGEALDDGGIPGILGGDCVEFQLAYSTLTMSALFGIGADDEQYADLERSLADMQGNVPDEIEDDFAIVSDAFRESMQLALTSGGLSGSTEGDEEEMAEAESLLASPEVVEAQNNIDTWLIENCA